MRNSVLISLGAAAAVAKAWWIRNGSGIKNIRLPRLAKERSADWDEIERTVRLVDKVVACLAFRTGHGCYYKAFARAYMLRHCGIDVALNIGLRNLEAGHKTKGHCWLTHDAKPIFEKGDVGGKYPVKLGERADSVCYWVGTCKAMPGVRRKLVDCCP